jgi:hypothetical protein
MASSFGAHTYCFSRGLFFLNESARCDENVVQRIKSRSMLVGELMIESPEFFELSWLLL